VLGTGEPALEARLSRGGRHPGNVAVHIGYDEALAHRLIAGGDAILVPSRFEPCGLTQLYALRYGTLPLVALTGGLADTVIAANDAALKRGAATGFRSMPLSAENLALRAWTSVCALCRSRNLGRGCRRTRWRIRSGWETSAAAYAALYRDLPEPDDHALTMTEPGRPAPLGATFDGEGVNFAVFSEHADADLGLHLFRGWQDRDASPRPAGAHGDVWHGYVAGLRPGQLYGLRADGPYAPITGTGSTPTSCCSTPMPSGSPAIRSGMTR
jgi:hypothetical protein